MIMFFARMSIGLIRGMDGPDIDKFIEDLPAQAGEEVGKLIRKYLDKNRRLTDEGEQELLELYKRKPELATQAATTAMVEDLDIGENDLLLPMYADVLNIVVSALRNNGRPIVLRGFLHTENCLTYWHFSNNPEKIKAFEVNEYSKKISLDHLFDDVSVYVIEDSFNEEQFHVLNSAIRYSKERKLDLAMYEDKKNICSIEEFKISYKIKKILDQQIGLSIDEEGAVPIPSGAPAMIDLIMSVPEAIKIQKAPADAVSKTIDKINEMKTDVT